MVVSAVVAVDVVEVDVVAIEAAVVAMDVVVAAVEVVDVVAVVVLAVADDEASGAAGATVADWPATVRQNAANEPAAMKRLRTLRRKWKLGLRG